MKSDGMGEHLFRGNVRETADERGAEDVPARLIDARVAEVRNLHVSYRKH